MQWRADRPATRPGTTAGQCRDSTAHRALGSKKRSHGAGKEEPRHRHQQEGPSGCCSRHKARRRPLEFKHAVATEPLAIRALPSSPAERASRGANLPTHPLPSGSAHDPSCMRQPVVGNHHMHCHCWQPWSWHGRCMRGGGKEVRPPLMAERREERRTAGRRDVVGSPLWLE